MNKYQNTFCNPLVLPDYPKGKMCRGNSTTPDYRETADPTVIYYDNKWYLYPSCGMAYVSEDFINWTHVRIDPYDVGYAPTVVLHKGKFYMTSCDYILRVADNPLGPFVTLGNIIRPDGRNAQIPDPMLFSDDDERLYIYWGLGGDGIRGAELDANDPTKMITEPKILFSYNPEHEWERIGEWNEDASNSYCEGSWMVKVNGKYFLTYCGPGTEWRTYSMGAYVSDSPLGPFTYQQRNPILSKKYGLVRGPGHGSIVKGPNDTLWAFYTCTVCYIHSFERRIGCDPAGIDENGNLFVVDATEIPQWAPGMLKNPELGNSAGIIPVSYRRGSSASSQAPGRDPLYALDDSMLTWWQPAEDDKEPTFYVNIANKTEVSALRLVWRDVGLDYDNGVLPGPFKYVLEGKKGDEWVCVVDESNNETDLLIDYRTFEPCVMSEFRLRILGSPKGITPGLINLTLFGRTTVFDK
ncbi:MAG: hypothetical protein E7315_03765 [Clostridiales bacterium]|nr:hypothetical protein [Clostridiales bacterium]